MKLKFNNKIKKHLLKQIFGWLAFLSYLLFIVYTSVKNLNNGLSSTEQNSILTSIDSFSAFKSLDFNQILLSVQTLNLPYHLIQGSFLNYLGVNIVTIYLPSIVFVVLFLSGLYLLIKKWFNQKTAIFTILIASSTPAILVMLQTSNSWSFVLAMMTWSILAADRSIQNKKIVTPWAVILALSISGLSYTAFGLWVLLALTLTALLHPYSRFLLKRQNKKNLGLLLILATAFILPTLISNIANPQNIIDSAGSVLQHIKEPIVLWENLVVISTTFLANNHLDSFGDISTIFTVSLLVTSTLGAYLLTKNFYMAKSYFLGLLSLIILIISLFDPQYILLLIFVFFILTAKTVHHYTLHLKNILEENDKTITYFTTLSMLLVTMSCIISFNLSYTRITLTHSEEIAEHKNTDLDIIQKALKEHEVEQIFVSEDEYNFYSKIFEMEQNNLLNPTEIVVSKGTPKTPKTGKFLTTTSVENSLSDNYKLEMIFTNDKKNQANRVYLFSQNIK